MSTLSIKAVTSAVLQGTKTLGSAASITVDAVSTTTDAVSKIADTVGVHGANLLDVLDEHAHNMSIERIQNLPAREALAKAKREAKSQKLADKLAEVQEQSKLLAEESRIKRELGKEEERKVLLARNLELLDIKIENNKQELLSIAKVIKLGVSEYKLAIANQTFKGDQKAKAQHKLVAQKKALMEAKAIRNAMLTERDSLT